MTTEHDEGSPAPAAKSRTGIYLLLGAVGLLLIPVVIGFVMANTGGEDDSSGMNDAGMGSSPDDAAVVAGFPVRPIDEILDGDLVIEPDPSGTSAVLRLTTTIDVACSVVYGSTSDFGGLATDTDMAGGGHRVHQPLMTDLEPGTTVLYRVQGTDAAGNIYVGEIEQFTTPGGDGTAAAPNLSLGATVLETSSDFSDNFAGANAIDGSLSTEWSSRGDGDDAYIVIDLGAEMDISGIGFRTREMSDGTSITNTYTVSIDDGAVLGPFDAGVGLVATDLEATGQVFRIEMKETTGGNTGAVEIEIYGN
jgi:hypothetical protein